MVWREKSNSEGRRPPSISQIPQKPSTAFQPSSPNAGCPGLKRQSRSCNILTGGSFETDTGVFGTTNSYNPDCFSEHKTDNNPPIAYLTSTKSKAASAGRRSCDTCTDSHQTRAAAWEQALPWLEVRSLILLQICLKAKQNTMILTKTSVCLPGILFCT